MARGFNTTLGTGTTDKIATAATGGAATRTWLIWSNRRADSAIAARMWHQVASTTLQIILDDNHVFTPNTYQFAYGWTSLAGGWDWTRPSAGVWVPIVVVYNNGSNANDPTVFQAGTKLTVGSGLNESLTPSGTPSDPAGNVTNIGNRNVSDRVWDGSLAEFAEWNVLLTDDECYALCKGYSPLLIRPSALVQYEPMVRENISVKGAASTVTGTAIQPHPPVIYPRRRWAQSVPAAAAAGLVGPLTRGGSLLHSSLIRGGRLAA